MAEEAEAISMLRKCTNLTSLVAKSAGYLAAIPHPELLQKLTIYENSGIQQFNLRDCSELKTLKIRGSYARFEQCPHPEKLKRIALGYGSITPSEGFWKQCSSLEHISITQGYYGKLDLSGLPHPEKVKRLKDTNISPTVLSSFTQIETLRVDILHEKLNKKSIKRLKLLSTFRQLRKLTLRVKISESYKLFFEQLIAQIAPNDYLTILSIEVWNSWDRYPKMDGEVLANLIGKFSSLQRLEIPKKERQISSAMIECWRKQGVQISTL
jgi:hypothetical protein